MQEQNSEAVKECRDGGMYKCRDNGGKSRGWSGLRADSQTKDGQAETGELQGSRKAGKVRLVG